jgi:hypothetical protein
MEGYDDEHIAQDTKIGCAFSTFDFPTRGFLWYAGDKCRAHTCA